MINIIKRIFFDQQSRGTVQRLIAEHVKPYRKQFLMAIACMLIAAIATAALPWLLKPVFDQVFAAKETSVLFIFCGIVLISFVAKALSSFGEACMMSYIGQNIVSDLQSRLFAHLMKADLIFFQRATSGELISRFTSDINLLRGAVANTLVGFGRDFFTLVFMIALMFYRDWMLAMVVFLIFPLAIIPIAKTGRRMRKVTSKTQNEVGHFTTKLNQIFQGIRIVKAYNMEEYERTRTLDMVRGIFELSYKAAKVRASGRPVVEILGGLATIGVIAYGGWQVMHGTHTAGDFASFIAAMLMSYEPLKRLSNLNANFQEGLAAAQRVFDVIDTPNHILNQPNAFPLRKPTGHIKFDSVSFSYDFPGEGEQVIDDGMIVLHDLNLEIKPGQSVALVGPSGSGKSTFINLIPRFYDVLSGNITIDGRDIRDMTMASLRENIALVSQEVVLFDESVEANIKYGTLGATDMEVQAAAKAAAADEFIKALPEGYKTVIGENGSKLSGGQRQRLVIARAMLKNAPILLLDEATSALDTNSERQVQSALKQLMVGRTTIMVAHRLSTVVEADVIYVLQEGKIIESGSHAKLLSKNGTYAALWQAQSEHPQDLLTKIEVSATTQVGTATGNGVI